jgi:N-acetylglucosaminyldiphosphoundecaprenol N-acetyl-beta-D-mannosaminyltransferase
MVLNAADMRARPFEISFTPQREAELAAEIARNAVPVDEPVRLLATANLNHIVDLAKNEAFRTAYRHAWKVTADGMPVYLYAKWRGCLLPERLTGSGLVVELFPLLRPDLHRVFVIAASNELAQECKNYFLSKGFPATSLAFSVPPFGFEKDPDRSEALARAVGAHGTTHLLLGVGAPKSEIWVDTHRSLLGPCYALCVGAGLDFFVGLKSRGPVWVRSAGLEWLWRFAQEPRRLFRRYFVDSWLFLWCVARDLRGKPLA